MVEVCDICGDIGVANALSKCWKCKISKQHVYCRKKPRIPQDLYGKWFCDNCERETMASPKCYVGTSSAQNRKHRRGERMPTKGKVRCITSEEVIKLESGSKKGESTIKTIKPLNLSPSRPVCPKTPIHRKSFPFKSPVTPSPSPVNKQTSYVTQRSGSHISNIPKVAGAKNATLVKEQRIPNEPLCGRSSKKQFVPPISSGIKDATLVKETSMQCEDFCGQLAEKQFPPLLSPDKPSVETEVASLGKKIYKASDASNTLSLKKQFAQPQVISAVGPVVEAEVATPRKEICKANEASSALSLKKQSPQPISSAAAPAGAKEATTVKEISLPREGLCGQLPEQQLSPRTSPRNFKFTCFCRPFLDRGCIFVLPGVETKMGKDMVVPIEASCAPSPEKQFMQGSTSGHQPSGDLNLRLSDIENGEAMIVEPKIRGPSFDFSWRGRFEFPKATFKFTDINTWFKAHPHFRVNRNVVDILLRLPELLQFQLIPRKGVWTGLFQDDCPDKDDIGLYFSSGENKRSSDYDFLLVFIDNLDLTMRCELSGAELFLFTSKVLIADHQKMNEKYFLWGVFRSIKKHKYVSKLYEELPHVVHHPNNNVNNSAANDDFAQNNDVNDNNNNDDDDCAVDMEIDMVGGKDVGKVDIAVPRDSPSGAYSNKGIANSSPFKELKKEPGLGCPPGFEEMYMQKKL